MDQTEEAAAKVKETLAEKHEAPTTRHTASAKDTALAERVEALAASIRPGDGFALDGDQATRLHAELTSIAAGLRGAK